MVIVPSTWQNLCYSDVSNDLDFITVEKDY